MQWLALQGRHQEASDSLSWARGPAWPLGTELEEFRSLYERSKEELNALQGEKDGLVRDLAGREQEYSGQHEQLQSEVLQLRTKLQEMAYLDENYTASVNEVQALQTLVESLRGENLQLVSQSKDQTELTESVLNEKDQYLAELEDLLAVNEKLKEEQSFARNLAHADEWPEPSRSARGKRDAVVPCAGRRRRGTACAERHSPAPRSRRS